MHYGSNPIKKAVEDQQHRIAFWLGCVVSVGLEPSALTANNELDIENPTYATTKGLYWCCAVTSKRWSAWTIYHDMCYLGVMQQAQWMLRHTNQFVTSVHSLLVCLTLA